MMRATDLTSSSGVGLFAATVAACGVLHCVSPAERSAESRAGADAVDDLHAELLVLSLFELRRRARTSGVAEERLEDALGNDQPEDATIQLIIQHCHQTQTLAAAALHAELRLLRMGGLMRRALAAGIDEAQLDEIEQTDDPKAAIIQVILRYGQHAQEPSLAVGSDDSPAVSEAHKQLRLMKLSALKTKAVEVGVDVQAISEADDMDDIKSEVIRLILNTSSEAASDVREASLRAELAVLKLSILKVRAASAGADPKAIAGADDADDIKSEIIRLIMQASQASASLTPLTDDEAGFIDHLRNGSANQRAQVYNELEAAIARKDVPRLCACVAVMFEVMCMDASEVDATEQQRIGLLLAKMVSVDPVTVGACCVKDDAWMSPYRVSGSALGMVLAKPLAELTHADALTFAYEFAWLSPVMTKGFTAVLAVAGVEELHFIVELFLLFTTPSDERNLRLSTLLMETLREGKSNPYALGGVWGVLGFLIQSRPQVVERVLDLGITELAMEELRTASPMEWASTTKDPSGHFGTILYAAAEQVCCADPKNTAQVLESGLIHAGLSVMKVAEVLSDAHDISVTAVVGGGLAVLVNIDNTLPEVQRLVREAASSLRFFLESDEPLVFVSQMRIDSPTYTSLVCALFFGRDESGGPFSFSQANLDGAVASTTELLHPASWGASFALLQNWTSLPNLSLAVSDTNKALLLRNTNWIPHLVDGLLLDESHPRNQPDQPTGPTDDATKAVVQHDYAECLAQLAVYAPGKKAMLHDSNVVRSLEQLVELAMTTEAKECARTALIALGVTKPETRTETLTFDGSKSPPHIMMSYSWDQQAIILRVVVWLQAHGYLIWVDTEQMKGATVDTMALAVEGSELMLLGVSRAYKESSNCRMEAQYGLQKKKPFIPLKLTDDYEADGWLGLMLGTSMWYALYGDTLSSESAFEDRMSSLSREIGLRGRADAVVTDGAPEPRLTTAAWFGDQEYL